ncbi:phosphoglycolate phosphatase [Alteromonas macleodii]|uniref:Phosphoglycolate phosphatase n=1 Tax=Alteromonas macleodii TaxID=28108 RepID=A0A6T9Y1K9_ALTMA|nr:phosphoglycolate phosphatase [Alteromonas macleodii]CAB9494174.1 Phosphoglycolate phosphatase [Alteromonas macleodii]
MQEINTFLFDLDGTLVDSVPDLATALNKMLSDYRLPTYDEHVIRHWVGNGARVLVERGLSGDTKINHNRNQLEVDTALDKFLFYYRTLETKSTVLYDGVFDTLHALKQRGYTLVLITNKPSEFIEPILSSFSLSSLFSLTIGGDSLAEKKPSALPLLYACEQFTISPSQCVMVGDSKNDILAAKAANIKSIGLTYGYNYGESIATYQPDWVFDNFNDILTTLS